ncbi:MAG: catalase family protein [Ktedonobacteraceae bacterium]
MSIKKRIHDVFLALFYFERRIDPYYRDTFDKIFRKLISAQVQALINMQRKDDHLHIGEEKLLPNEKAITALIIKQMAMFTHRQYEHSFALRAGNTKTYGVVRGEFEVLPDLPDNLRQGVFRYPKTFPAWIRFAGPGPLAPADMKDNGVLSIGIKLMGVEGDKLLDDEKWTQDFTGISAPTFTTPNIQENLKLQKQVFEGTPLFYFINPFDSHFLDGIMQGLYSKTQTSPLEVRYFSCVAYLYGDGQAIHYSIKPCSNEKTKIPKKPADNYLRDAMVKTLSIKEVSFDFMIQFQTDAYRMPIENASVEWSERLSPWIRVARLRLPVQRFDAEGQLAFAENLSYNPWHCIADHRPLGNQNRARKTIYYELSELRQSMNREARIEPTGAEVFDD